MTRNKAMEKAFIQAVKISDGGSSDNLSILIDKIFDDFESQTHELILLRETVKILHESMTTAEKRGHDKAMQEMESQDEV